MPQVFISFSTRDRDEAEQIRGFLESRGIQCWMAPQRIEPGTDWPRTLVEAIDSSLLLLVLLTESANDSPHVALEVAHAISSRRQLLVVRVEAIEPAGNIAYFLGLSQRMDVFPPPLSQYLDLVAGGVKSLLKSKEPPTKSRTNEPRSSPSSSCGMNQESFTEASGWHQLVRIGRWSFAQETGILMGQGMFSYLLSSEEFGHRPFVISSSITFDGYARHAHRTPDTANAGFVLGWVNGPAHHSYVNVLMNGKRLLFETVGARGGDSYSDYEHLEDGVPFLLQDKREYDFQLQVSGRRVLVFVDGEFIHNYQLTAVPIGRVGLRPWRARMDVRHFAVSEQ